MKKTNHNYYNDQFVSEQQQSSDNRATTEKKTESSSSSLIGIFSRFMSDCFDDELVALNQDFKDDVIISGIKNLLSDEYVEFREDNNMCRQEEGQGHKEDQHDINDIAMLQSMLIDQNNNGGDGCYSSFDDTIQTTSTKNNDDDDERSDFLLRMRKGIFNNPTTTTTTTSEMMMIPSSIQFKPNKNRNRNTSRCDDDNRHHQNKTLSLSQKADKSSNIYYSNRNINTFEFEDQHGTQRDRIMIKNNGHIAATKKNITITSVHKDNEQKNAVKASRWRNKNGLHLFSFRKKK